MARLDRDDLSRLIVATGAGDHRCFERLHKHTSIMLFGVCVRILRDPREAEDAVQDVFLKVWKHADSFVAERLSAIAWLHTIARNEAIGRVRHRRRSPISPGAMDEIADRIADPAPGPDAYMVKSLNADILLRCFQQIGPQRAAAVRGAYIEGRSYAELAFLHQVPLNTMRTWLRRGLIDMRACFEREFAGEGRSSIGDTREFRAVRSSHDVEVEFLSM